MQLTDHRRSSVSEIMKCLNDRGDSCASRCPHDFEGLQEEGVEDGVAAAETNVAARHYRASSFSLTKLLRSVMANQEHRTARANSSTSYQLPPQGVRECEFFSLLYQDEVHPSKVGSLLLADMLVDHLVRAKAALEQKQIGGASWVSRRLPQPMHQQSITTPVLRCFGVFSDSADDDLMRMNFPGRTSSAAMNVTRCGSSHRRSQGLEEEKPGGLEEDCFSLFFHCPGPSVRSEGWTLVREENGKPRPGWVATRPGSELWIQLEASELGSTDMKV